MKAWVKHFAEHFRDQTEDYVVIGGTAATILVENSGLTFRATKDIDLVVIGSDTENFCSHFATYVRLGKYSVAERDGRKNYYRFLNPTDEKFPPQLEVFSRNVHELELYDGQYIVPVGTNLNNKLSAILLEDEYFQLICKHRTALDGVSLAQSTVVITLKARAYNDMTERKLRGDAIDSNDIKKHRNDIIKLSATLAPDDRCLLSGVPKQHLERFLSDLSARPHSDIKQILKNAGWAASSNDWFAFVKTCFGL